MSYTNSKLVDCKVMSPNHSGTRTHEIDVIIPHCVVGQLGAEGIGYCFDDTSREASCNYGIGTDGRVCLIVEEKNRSWCTSSRWIDQRGITIECASDKTEPYAMNDKVYNKLIDLCVDICKRNGKTKLLWFADKDKTFDYLENHIAKDEMVLAVHRWFANKSCPGNWLYGRLGEVAAEVTKRLGGATPTQKKELLEVDGEWGRDTTTKTQKVFGTPQDGEISYQDIGCKEYLPNCFDSSWKFDESCKGSTLIRTIQKFLADLSYYKGKIDGLCGKKTVMAMQQFLNDRAYNCGRVDGVMGEKTVMAWQKYINSRLQ